MPFVSVVVPTFNRKDLLERCIASLQEQTYPKDHYEILVIDNGSHDVSWELLERLAQQYSIPVQLYRNHSSYRVPAASRNLGVREARGELIAFTDSDCIAAPDWLEKGVRCFSAGVGVVKGKTIAATNGEWPILARTVVSLSPICYFETCNVFYRTEALRVVGGFARDFIEDYTFPYFGEDAELAFRVLQAG
jgi:glycosyltransferase involved in cell wall biosynthesis